MATIYAKTVDGQREIETRARRLAPRARSALILVDGKRSDLDLAKLVQQADIVLKELLDAGLIEVTVTLAAKPATVAREPAPAATVAPAAQPGVGFEASRREAVRAVHDLLGPEADSLALRLERAGNGDELRAALERAVAYIANARGGGAAAKFAARFLSDSA